MKVFSNLFDLFSLPWFMDQPFQVPTQYCSSSIGLHSRFFTASDFPFTNRHIHNRASFSLWLTSSCFPKLFLCSSLIAQWTASNREGSSFKVISFWLFILLTGLSWQECWSVLPFASLAGPFHLNSLPWPVCLGWPCRARHTLSPSHTRLWSMCS